MSLTVSRSVHWLWEVRRLAAPKLKFEMLLDVCGMIQVSGIGSGLTYYTINCLSEIKSICDEIRHVLFVQTFNNGSDIAATYWVLQGYSFSISSFKIF